MGREATDSQTAGPDEGQKGIRCEPQVTEGPKRNLVGLREPDLTVTDHRRTKVTGEMHRDPDERSGDRRGACPPSQENEHQG